jgi:hypothetical protein
MNRTNDKMLFLFKKKSNNNEARRRWEEAKNLKFFYIFEYNIPEKNKITGKLSWKRSYQKYELKYRNMRGCCSDYYP